MASFPQDWEGEIDDNAADAWEKAQVAAENACGGKRVTFEIVPTEEELAAISEPDDDEEDDDDYGMSMEQLEEWQRGAS